jgi:hypothetical protein
MMLDRIGRSLEDIVSSGKTLRYTISRIVKCASSEDWLDDLLDAVQSDRPHKRPLQVWIRSYGLVDRSDPSPPTQQQLLDSVYFDLRELRKAIRQAKSAASSRVLGFGVTYSESTFVNKLCDWLANCVVGQTQRKDPLNLKPELAPVSHRLHQIERYRRDLASVNVLCLIHADDAPPEYIAEFWGRIAANFADTENFFVLVFTGSEATAFPGGLTVLPPPRFDLDDVAQWAEDLISRAGWPPNLADAWTDLLCEDALDDGNLDVRGLYEAMDRSIQEIRFDPNAFRAQLEERIRHASTA